jgi:hypothetical protein
MRTAAAECGGLRLREYVKNGQLEVNLDDEEAK